MSTLKLENGSGCCQKYLMSSARVSIQCPALRGVHWISGPRRRRSHAPCGSSLPPGGSKISKSTTTSGGTWGGTWGGTATSATLLITAPCDLRVLRHDGAPDKDRTPRLPDCRPAAPSRPRDRSRRQCLRSLPKRHT